MSFDTEISHTENSVHVFIELLGKKSLSCCAAITRTITKFLQKKHELLWSGITDLYEGTMESYIDKYDNTKLQGISSQTTGITCYMHPYVWVFFL